jgi:streptogramin lyase
VTVTLSDKSFAYEVASDWARLPEGWYFGDVAAVAVDHKDHVYVFNRGPHPMMVFDSDGLLLRSWGEGVFQRPHGLHIGHDGAIYCTDDGDHTVRKCAADGTVLMRIGVPGRPSTFMGGRPFNRCTHTALAPDGEIYVSDGYGNACVHRFSPDGTLLQTWGESGSGKGQFYIPHNICCDRHGWVYVADRENHRIQIFDAQGRFETQWHDLHRPCALCTGNPPGARWYVGEVGPAFAATLQFPNLGPRISILNHHGELLARLGNLPAGITPGCFIAPHGIAVDSAAAIYLGEVSYTAWPQVFPGSPRPDYLPTLHKLTPVAVAHAS